MLVFKGLLSGGRICAGHLLRGGERGRGPHRGTSDDQRDLHHHLGPASLQLLSDDGDPSPKRRFPRQEGSCGDEEAFPPVRSSSFRTSFLSFRRHLVISGNAFG